MSTVKVVRGARIHNSELYGPQRKMTPYKPRSVFFKCPEPMCGFEHATWNLISQHLYHHHGWNQETIDLEECEQRKSRRNKTWIKRRLDAMNSSSDALYDEEGNEIVEEDNLENDMKPSPIVLEAMLKQLPRDGAKDGCQCPILECSAVLPNRVELVKHARVAHRDHPTAVGNFEIRQEVFENEDDFKDWKSSKESEHSMFFACESTGRAGECKNFFFVCHRSGRVVRRMRAERERRAAEWAEKAGTSDSPLRGPKKRNKIVKAQEYCTAWMRARRDALGRFHVAYSTSHIGHDSDPAMLPLTPAMKKTIYDRIVAEYGDASCSLIASRIRSDFSDENSRMHYVTANDVVEVIRMERKRLAKVGGAEAEQAHEIFRVNCKKGRRKMGQELLSSGERHKPPLRLGAGSRRGGGREETMGGKPVLHHDYARPIKLDDDEDDDELGDDVVEGEELVIEGDEDDVEEGMMHHDDDDHHLHAHDAFIYEEEVEEEHDQGVFMVHDDEDDVVDDTMLQSSQPEEEVDEEEDGMPHLTPSSSSSRVAAVRPTQRGQQQQSAGHDRAMAETVNNKHRMDEHVDNICEALVRHGNPAKLQEFLDEIHHVSARFEHFLRR